MTEFELLQADIIKQQQRVIEAHSVVLDALQALTREQTALAIITGEVLKCKN